MGNSHSQQNAPRGRSRSTRRASMSRELEQLAYPTGLYPTCPWDTRAAKRLVMEKKIAPRIPGRECKDIPFTEECPICFMYYPDGCLNTTACCKKAMCSECFLQLKPPREVISCPFCNHEGFTVKYSMPSGLNLAAIVAATTSSDTNESCPTPTSLEPPVMRHMASVEERERLEQDLRSQLNISNQPIRGSSLSSRDSAVGLNDGAGFVTEPHYFFASAADAARLEEIMLMEAIRRSMRDLTVAAKPSSDGDADHDDDADESSVELEDGEYDTLRPSQIALDSSGNLSSDPFDDSSSSSRRHLESF